MVSKRVQYYQEFNPDISFKVVEARELLERLQDVTDLSSFSNASPIYTFSFWKQSKTIYQVLGRCISRNLFLERNLSNGVAEWVSIYSRVEIFLFDGKPQYIHQKNTALEALGMRVSLDPTQPKKKGSSVQSK